MERVREAIKITNRWGIRFCFVFGGLLVIESTFIATTFAKDGSDFLIGITTKALTYNGIVFLLFGYQNVYSTAFLAMGRAKEGGIMSLSRQGLFFYTAYPYIANVFGVQGILYAQPIADILTIGLTRYFVFNNKELLSRSEPYEQKRIKTKMAREYVSYIKRVLIH